MPDAGDGTASEPTSTSDTWTHPELPVMMVTAYGDDERQRPATELGAPESLTKPVDFNLLRVRFRQLPNAAD
jgi:DNA-binding response OmpR family regulator